MIKLLAISRLFSGDGGTGGWLLSVELTAPKVNKLSGFDGEARVLVETWIGDPPAGGTLRDDSCDGSSTNVAATDEVSESVDELL